MASTHMRACKRTDPSAMRALAQRCVARAESKISWICRRINGQIKRQHKERTDDCRNCASTGMNACTRKETRKHTSKQTNKQVNQQTNKQEKHLTVGEWILLEANVRNECMELILVKEARCSLGVGRRVADVALSRNIAATQSFAAHAPVKGVLQRGKLPADHLLHLRDGLTALHFTCCAAC
jgi:hypothetical protein